MDQYFEYSDRLNAPLEAFTHQSAPENFPILPHWHYFIEIIYLLEGDTFVTCDDHVYALHPGDLIFFPPQHLHTIDALETADHHLSGYLPDYPASRCRLLQETANPRINLEHGAIYPIPIHSNQTYHVRYHVLKFDLSALPVNNRWKIHFNRLSEHAYATDPANILFPADSICDVSARELMAHSIQEMHSHRYGNDVIISSNITALLTAFIRRWLENGMRLDDILAPSAAGNQNFEQITEYIHTHYQEPLQVQALADYCGMSYSYFAKLFRETYGRPCKEYIEFVRINKAAELLLYTNQDLNYISQETGFADCSHLIRTFRKQKGCTPRQWAKNIKQNERLEHHEMDA